MAEPSSGSNSVLQRIKLEDGSYQVLLPINTSDEVFVDISTGKTLTMQLNEMLTMLYDSMKFCEFNLSQNQSILKAVATTILFDTKNSHNNEDFGQLLPNGNIQILKAGTYYIDICVGFSLRNSEMRSIQLYINNNLVATRTTMFVKDNVCTLTITGNYEISAGSTLYLEAYQKSDRTIDIESNISTTRMQIRKVG